MTSRPRLTLTGTASDSAGVQSVFYQAGKKQQLARGTTSWRLKVKLKPGANRIRIFATDTVANQSAAKRARVRRQ